jgi:hypothetical protein
MSHDERKGLGINLFFGVDFMKDTYKKGFARLVTVIILCQLDEKTSYTTEEFLNSNRMNSTTTQHPNMKSFDIICNGITK